MELELRKFVSKDEIWERNFKTFQENVTKKEGFFLFTIEDKREHDRIRGWILFQKENFVNLDKDKQSKIKSVVDKFEENNPFSFELLLQKRTARWLERYFELKLYLEKNGKKFTFPGGDRNRTNLRKWLTHQKSQMRENKLLKQQEDLLLQLGVKPIRTGRVKTLKKIREDKWNAQFLDLKAYYESKGDFNVKRNENYELAKWICNQRKAYHKNTLTENRKQKLNEIKFVWEKH